MMPIFPSQYSTNILLNHPILLPSFISVIRQFFFMKSSALLNNLNHLNRFCLLLLKNVNVLIISNSNTRVSHLSCLGFLITVYVQNREIFLSYRQSFPSFSVIGGFTENIWYHVNLSPLIYDENLYHAMQKYTNLCHFDSLDAIIYGITFLWQNLIRHFDGH